MAKTNTGEEYSNILLTERGVDSGRSPSLINPNQLAWGVNLTVRGGYMRQRPVWRKLPVVWPNGVTSGLFQGAEFFMPNIGPSQPGFPQFVVAIAGKLYSLLLNTLVATDITPDSISPADRPIVWMLQAQQFLVTQDDWTHPIVWDGNRSWRLNATNPVTGNYIGLPNGQTMAYSQGRIWVSKGNQYTAGDIVFGPSGTLPYNLADSILYNTENQFINEGGAFSIPFGNETIRSMVPAAMMDTSLGQGPLMIFTNNSVFSNDAPQDRTTWKSLQTPIQTNAQLNYGGVSNFANLSVNGDIWYRAKDGLRSLRVAQRRFVDAWGNLPMSREIKRALLRDDPNLLQYCSAVLFDNRLLVTCAPQFVLGHGVPFSGLGVLDLDILSAMDQLWMPANRVPPAYDGLWTGLRILKIVTTSNQTPDRCIAFALNASNQIEVWELLQSDDQTSQLDNGVQPVEWTFETKSFDFGDGAAIKRLTQAEMWLDEIVGEVTLQWYFRPDQDPSWHVWSSKQYCTPATTCYVAGCNIPQFNQPGYQPRRRLPEPNGECDPSVNKFTNLGYEFQMRCVVTGACRIRKVRFTAKPRSDDPHATCDDVVATCYPNPGCGVNDFDYSIG